MRYEGWKEVEDEVWHASQTRGKVDDDQRDEKFNVPLEMSSSWWEEEEDGKETENEKWEWRLSRMQDLCLQGFAWGEGGGGGMEMSLTIITSPIWVHFIFRYLQHTQTQEKREQRTLRVGLKEEEECLVVWLVPPCRLVIVLNNFLKSYPMSAYLRAYHHHHLTSFLGRPGTVQQTVVGLMANTKVSLGRMWPRPRPKT